MATRLSERREAVRESSFMETDYTAKGRVV
jgi:hypothetical protein